ncbi:MAG: ATP-dependent Clp protease ATP-binding subunit [Clostridia bacterium]|nr:ATP-dependent Clp protease ATP-binding subunit [Clostridia bacterium]
MAGLTLYTYDRKNWDAISDTIKLENIKVLTAQEMSYVAVIRNTPKKDGEEIKIHPFKHEYYDISLLISGDNERVDVWSGHLITALQLAEEDHNKNRKFIVDKKYASDILSALFYFFSDSAPLEKFLKLDDTTVTNIVDCADETIVGLGIYLQANLFGNPKFKTRLIQELKRFRLFNKLGERKVFSAFVCGPSGIGKTLTAKLLHDFLAPNERYIKINLGNYSDHNALSSLIGSPRGYVGSSKGELSSKIAESKSTVILIDEFEKASQEVHNFFLELLADGKFTDSQGREYDLNKYIIIFTSNIDENEFNRKIPPELRSRFDLVYKMVLLSKEEKTAYIQYKTNYYVEQAKEMMGISLESDSIIANMGSKVMSLDNIRFITREIEQYIAAAVEEKQ